MNYDAILSEYMAAPEGAKPRWVDLARKYMTGDPSDQLELGRAGDRVRMYISRHRNDRAALSRAEQLATEHPYLKAKCDEHGLPIDRTHYYWAKVDGASIKIDIPREGGRDVLEAVRDIVAQTKPRPYEPIAVNPEREESLAGILSDMHVGLNPNPNRRAMYPVEYNADIFRANINKFYSALKFNTDFYGPVGLLSVSDLGDAADGLNNTTARGGHALEQNMDNVAQFQTLVEEKIRLAENLIHSGMARRYVFNNVTNSNHDGDFAALINLTVQMILERSYPKEVLSFRVMQKPIEHFIYGDHAVIVMHGKDQQYQFKGLPLTLNAQTEKVIRTYIDYHKITSKYIHAWKGDLHQNAYSRCQLFDYRSFCSLAPPSQWISNNFPGSYSGFAIQRIPKWSADIQHTDYLIEYERVADAVPAHEYVY